MSSSRLRAALAGLALGAPLLATFAPVTAHADAAPYTEISVQIPATQPDDEGNAVTLDGGIDIPTTGCPCPILMINHGFLGSWHDSQDVADRAARNGYIVIRYSSRGFGNTSGEVDLVGPKERQDQIDALKYVEDATAPQLKGLVDPVAAVYGGSYGGAHAWAATQMAEQTLEPYDATIGATVKAVVPAATWTDLYQALVPNDVFRMTYTDGFYATGYDPSASVVNGATSGSPQNTTPSAQQNYSQELHRWMIEANAGVDMADMQSGLASHSVLTAGNIAKITTPVFMIQGSNDGLFSENQALAAFQALHAQGTPVRLYVGGIGHPPADGSTTSPEALGVMPEVMAWINHYVRGTDNGIDRMPPIEFANTQFFNNHWDGSTRSAYAYPFGPAQTLSLCTASTSGGTLDSAACPSANPAVAASVPSGSGYDQEPVSQKYVHEAIQDLTGCTVGSPTCQNTDPSLDSTPSVLSYDAAPVTASTEYAGLPTLHLVAGSADVLPASDQGGAAAFQLDPKLYDVAADGTATLITRGAYAEPLNAAAPSTQTIPSHEVSFDAFGMSYLLPAGHHWRLTLSTSDVPFLKPEANPFAVVLFAGSTISLPTAVQTFPTPALGQPGPGADLPEAPLPALLALTAVVAGAAAIVVRRRRSAS